MISCGYSSEYRQKAFGRFSNFALSPKAAKLEALSTSSKAVYLKLTRHGNDQITSRLSPCLGDIQC